MKRESAKTSSIGNPPQHHGVPAGLTPRRAHQRVNEIPLNPPLTLWVGMRLARRHKKRCYEPLCCVGNTRAHSTFRWACETCTHPHKHRTALPLLESSARSLSLVLQKVKQSVAGGLEEEDGVEAEHQLASVVAVTVGVLRDIGVAVVPVGSDFGPQDEVVGWCPVHAGTE